MSEEVKKVLANCAQNFSDGTTPIAADTGVNGYVNVSEYTAV